MLNQLSHPSTPDFSFCTEKCQWEFYRDCTESIHRFGQYWQLSNIKDKSFVVVVFSFCLLVCFYTTFSLAAMWKTVRQVLKMLNIELPGESAIPPRYIPPQNRKMTQTDTIISIHYYYYSLLIIPALFTGAKTWKHPRVCWQSKDKYCVIRLAWGL